MKLIVNENHRLAKSAKNQQCAHPKHEEYIKDNKRGRPRKHCLKKISRRLQPILNLPPDTLVCNPCLNAMDCDKENQQFSSLNNIEYSHNDLMYSAKVFKELEVAYNEVCEELDRIKLSM